LRQITIQCSHRGALLVRVRDEFRVVVQSYQALYESAIAYGMRKALVADQKKAALQVEIQRLEQDCTHLEKSVADLDTNVQTIKKTFQDECNAEDSKHQEQIRCVLSRNQLIKEAILRHLGVEAKTVKKSVAPAS
jgi:dynein light intermediate chain